jgi:hypothetical protein
MNSHRIPQQIQLLSRGVLLMFISQQDILASSEVKDGWMMDTVDKSAGDRN